MHGESSMKFQNNIFTGEQSTGTALAVPLEETAAVGRTIVDAAVPDTITAATGTELSLRIGQYSKPKQEIEVFQGREFPEHNFRSPKK